MAFDLSMPILVVDDYNTMIRIIRNLLKQIGFENVDDASDGSAGKRCSRAPPPNRYRRYKPPKARDPVRQARASIQA